MIGLDKRLHCTYCRKERHNYLRQSVKEWHREVFYEATFIGGSLIKVREGVRTTTIGELQASTTLIQGPDHHQPHQTNQTTTNSPSMPPIPIPTTPKIVIYYQTQHHSDGRSCSILPIITQPNIAVTHVIVAAIHLNDPPGNITLVHPPSFPRTHKY